MSRSANSERSTVVEESRKTPPEQVKGIAAAGQKFTHALFAM